MWADLQLSFTKNSLVFTKIKTSLDHTNIYTIKISLKQFPNNVKRTLHISKIFNYVVLQKVYNSEEQNQSGKAD